VIHSQEIELRRPITERKRAEDALRRSETYLAEAQRLSLTGSFGWKIARQEIFWSDETYRIFGYDRTIEPTIERALQRVHPDDVALVRQTIDEASQDKKDIELEHRLLMPDGTIKHLRVLAHAATDPSDGLELVGAVTDVSATKRAQEALHQAQLQLTHVTRVTMLGELTASIAHEVNQPLTGIVANGEASLRWLQHKVPDIHEARGALMRIISDADRASNVIRRIRDLSKKAVPEMRPLDINDVVEEALLLVQRQALSHRVMLRLNLASGLPAALGDWVQLQQVIINLAINGIEAMASVSGRRELVVRSDQYEADQVLVAVQDSGVGIEPEQVDRLFSAFYTTKPDGMGMGLSICRSIVEAHGGRVWASNNDARGATIQFALPHHRR
jgi:C4-dicarboxylate-specific signal transduction histidine kinase